MVHRAWVYKTPQRDQHRGVAALALLLGLPGSCTVNQGWSLAWRRRVDSVTLLLFAVPEG